MKKTILYVALVAMLALSGIANAQTCDSGCGCACRNSILVPPKWEQGCWEVSAGALYLQRHYNNDAPIIINSPNPVSSGILDDDWETGFALEAKNNNWEIRYLQVDSYAESATGGPGGVFLGGGFGGLATIDYDTDLYSGEVNRYLNSPCCATRVFAGFRYIGLDEEMVFSTAAAGPLDRLTTSNDLYGVQLGVDSRLWKSCDGRFYADGVAKAGVYYATTEVDNTAFGVFQLSDSTDEVAFVGDLEVSAGWNINCWLSVEAAYQAMWIEGVALAGEQATTTSPFVGAGVANINHGGMLFHGAKISVVARW